MHVLPMNISYEYSSCCDIYVHTMHAWLTMQMLWQMHGGTLQAVHMLIVCMGIF